MEGEQHQFGFTLFNVHTAMTSAIDTALTKFLQARSLDAQSRPSPAHAEVHARNLAPAEGNDQPETGPSGMAENMEQEEKPDLLEAQPSNAPVDRVCDLTNPLDSEGYLAHPVCPAGCKWTTRTRPDFTQRAELMDRYMKHLTACRMLARLPSAVSIRFDMRGVTVWYTVRPGSGTKGRSTYGKQGFQLEGQPYVDATNMQRLPGEVMDILMEPIEGLRRAPQGSAAGSEPQAASVYSPGEVSPPNQNPDSSTHNEGLRMIRGPVALRAETESVPGAEGTKRAATQPDRSAKRMKPLASFSEGLTEEDEAAHDPTAVFIDGSQQDLDAAIALADMFWIVNGNFS